jgi:uncharacterized protein (DUF2249 family)
MSDETNNPADRVIDARELEPPEPFVQTMAALDTLVPGQRLRLILSREPYPLYRALELNGIAWRSERTAAGDFEIVMWRDRVEPMAIPTDLDCPGCHKD